MSLDIRRRRHSRVTNLASLRTISMWSSSLFSSSSLICLRYLSLSMRLWENWCWASSLARNACKQGEVEINNVIYTWSYTITSTCVHSCTAEHVCVCFHLVPLLLHLLQLYGNGVYAVAIHLTVLLQRGALQLQILLLLQILHTHTYITDGGFLWFIKPNLDRYGKRNKEGERRKTSSQTVRGLKWGFLHRVCFTVGLVGIGLSGHGFVFPGCVFAKLVCSHTDFVSHVYR